MVWYRVILRSRLEVVRFCFTLLSKEGVQSNLPALETFDPEAVEFTRRR